MNEIGKRNKKNIFYKPKATKNKKLNELIYNFDVKDGLEIDLTRKKKDQFQREQIRMKGIQSKSSKQ